jgi:hypothetical protein
VDWTAEPDDFANTAALIAALDLVMRSTRPLLILLVRSADRCGCSTGSAATGAGCSIAMTARGNRRYASSASRRCTSGQV